MVDGSRSSRAGDSSADTHPFWTRLLILSIGDTIFIALLAVLACTSLSMRLLGDAGIGWHIRTGQQILATHAVPRVDSFSSVMRGKTWYAWEWLYDVIVGALDRWAGLNGVVWFTAVVIAGVFACTFRLLLRRGTNVFVALVLLLLAASASMIHFLARPHVLSWLFTLMWFWILDSSESDCLPAHSAGLSATRSATISRRRLWLLPLLTLVWVNVHGGFLIGFALLAIYWLSAVWYAFRLKEDKFPEFLAKLRCWAEARRLAAVGFAAGVASLVNPHGWNLYAHIYGYLSNRFLMDHIDEFQSPNFHGVAERCFVVLMLAAMVALASRPRTLRMSEVLVILFAMYSGLYASRNIPVSSLLLALIVGPLLSSLLSSAIHNFAGRLTSFRTPIDRVSAFTERMGAVESSLQGHLWATAAAVFLGVVAVRGGSLGTNQLMDAHFDSKRFPAAAVDFLDRKTAGERDPVTVPDYWGGYLIYWLCPRTLVAVDDRHDLYGEEFFKSYLKMVHVEPGWDGLLEKYQARCILVPKGSALANILELRPPWKRVYADDVGVIFERTR